MSLVAVKVVPDTNPTLIKLPPVMLPVALILSPALRLLLVILPEPPRALLTTKLLRLPTLCKKLAVTLALSVVPVIKDALVVAWMPVNKLPLPTKYVPAMFPALLILPATLTMPPVLMLPPATLPVALTIPTELRFCAMTLPAAEIAAPLMMFPPLTLADTVKFPRVPTVVKLDVSTLELRVVPVNKLAAGLEITPVSAEPLPINKPPATTLPVADKIPLLTNCPVTVAPVPDTTNTFATPVLLIRMVES